MATVFLVMATACGFRSSEKKPIPLKVFNDRARAEEWMNVRIDYHINTPKQPTGSDCEDEWADWRLQKTAWRADHPAGVVVSDYQHYGVYEVPLGQ